MTEDSAFGAVSYLFDGRQVSRDLLDSILEIYFLEDHLGIMAKDDLTVTDIGAGYGRLAHRMVEALPNLREYLCADAVPVSSFLCEYYLRYRGVERKARILPLDMVQREIEEGKIDLAVNIHSFSECTLPVIEWWLRLREEKRIPALMIVPNSGEDLLTNDGKDFLPLVEACGYQRRVVEPKYTDPALQRYALNPDHFHLYTRP